MSDSTTSTLNMSFILLVSAVAALGGLLFGFDTAVISGTIPYIQPYFNLDAAALGWAVGCILLGCGLGALGAGRLSERYGRRTVLLGCAGLFALSGAGVALSESIEVFVIFRLVGGLGVGAAAMVSPMYIAEMAPATWRGRLVSLYQLAIVIGILLAYYINYALSNAGPDNWRWMFGSQLAPAGLFALLLLLVPETPRWLAKKGHAEAARRVLARTGGTDFANDEFNRISASLGHEPEPSVGELASPRYRPILVIGILVAVFQQITGINAILYYAPVIFSQTGIGTADSLGQTIGLGVVNVLATLVAIALVDRVGRKQLLMVGSVLMGISLTVVAACFHYQYFDNYVVLIAMLTYVGSFGATLGAVAWVYLSEIFPNRIRELALSAATLMLWLADFAVTYTFPIMTQRLGTATTLMTYAVFCGIAFAYMWLQIPETRGKTLEEIEHSFLQTQP